MIFFSFDFFKPVLMGELEGGRSVAVAVGVSDNWLLFCMWKDGPANHIQHDHQELYCDDCDKYFTQNRPCQNMYQM